VGAEDGGRDVSGVALMAASVARAAAEVLTTGYTAMNALIPLAADKVSVYVGGIPGSPTRRYVVVWAAEPDMSRGSWGARAADGGGIVSLQYAASHPDSLASAANDAARVANVGNLALVDTPLQVDGLGPNIYLSDPVSQPPFEVAVVADRVTSEISTQFTYTANRL
jgi:hypothetical protein